MLLHATIWHCVLMYCDLPPQFSKAISTVCTLKQAHPPPVGVCSVIAGLRNGYLYICVAPPRVIQCVAMATMSIGSVRRNPVWT